MTQFLDKSLQNQTYALQNIGIIDRTVRLVVGSIMIGAWFIYPVDTFTMWSALLPLLGVFPLLTGILGWCPTYAVFHTKSCGTDKRNNCGTFPDQLDHLFHPH
jgi:hypothetical protein